MKYVEFNMEKISKMMGESYHIIYINYEKKDGIEIATSFESMINNPESFYKMYVFNRERMYTCINFGDEMKMLLTERSQMVVEDGIEEREIYLKTDEVTKIVGKDYKKILVNIGYIGKKQVYQYAGLI